MIPVEVHLFHTYVDAALSIVSRTPDRLRVALDKFEAYLVRTKRSTAKNARCRRYVVARYYGVSRPRGTPGHRAHV